MTANFFNIVWNINICEAVAIAKRRAPYPFHTRGDYDIRQTTASVKRRINDICHTIRNNNARQFFAPNSTRQIWRG